MRADRDSRGGHGTGDAAVAAVLACACPAAARGGWSDVFVDPTDGAFDVARGPEQWAVYVLFGSAGR